MISIVSVHTDGRQVFAFMYIHIKREERIVAYNTTTKKN